MTRDMALLILGLGPSATVDDAKTAFRQKTSQWHPDKHGGDASKNEAMRQIVEAKQVLLGEKPASASNDEVEAEDEDEDEDEYLADFEEMVRRLRKEKKVVDEQPFCRAYTLQGEPCSLRAKKGNYGFCGKHRR